jgi:nucleoside-diphosphate-sugar epimerase
MVERQLDALEAADGGRRVVRLRPGLIFKAEAGPEIARYFLGPLAPRWLLRPGTVPALPRNAGILLQGVASDDVARAYAAALHHDVRGAFNVATDEVLDLQTIAGIVGARTVPLPGGVLRALAAVTHAAHLQPTDAGWVDLARSVPVMATDRARRELGWTPRTTAADALRAALQAMADREGGPTPPLTAPDRGGLTHGGANP